jgi:hypothetical protein
MVVMRVSVMIATPILVVVVVLVQNSETVLVSRCRIQNLC